MRHYLGFSVAEAADTMGCPEGTVKRLTHEALGSLRRSPSSPSENREVRNAEGGPRGSPPSGRRGAFE
jgi:hypothetical protein